MAAGRPDLKNNPLELLVAAELLYDSANDAALAIPELTKPLQDTCSGCVWLLGKMLDGQPTYFQWCQIGGMAAERIALYDRWLDEGRIRFPREAVELVVEHYHAICNLVEMALDENL